MNPLNGLTRIAASRGYWLALSLLGIAQLAIALYYQYVLDEPPCMLCIHVRILVAAFVLLALPAWLIRPQGWLLSGIHAVVTLIMAALLERSWILLGTERGTVMASCEFELGLPAWLALDKWLPALFEVQATCGYTPELLFGITMAEGLFAMFGGLVVISAVLTVASLKR